MRLIKNFFRHGLSNTKIAAIIFIIFLYTFPVISGVTSTNVLPVGASGSYVEATSVNNPVFHMQITTDGADDTITYLGVENFLDSWYTGSAMEPESIAPGSIKVWYFPSDVSEFNEASAQYVTYLAGDGGDWWHNTFSFSVADGSGIWVTADIIADPEVATLEFQAEDAVFSSGFTFDSSGEPASPPVLLITQASPAEIIEISHSAGTMQPYVSTSQEGVIPMSLSFFNNSGPGSAAVVINSITITVESFSPPGNILPPTDIIKSIKIQNKNTGTIYGQVNQAALPATASPIQIPLSLINIPAETIMTANIIIEITDSDSAAGSNFILSVSDYNFASAFDYYTYKPVSVHASPYDSTGFAMKSLNSVIQKKALLVNADFDPSVIPGNINKGQVNVPLMELYFDNPGDTNTAAAEVHNLNFTLLDDNSVPLTPSEIFTRFVITDPSGTIIYGSKNAANLETSGNTIYFPLLNTAGIPAASSTTLVVRADINPSTAANSFKIGIESVSGILARDTNSFVQASVSPLSPMPFYSELALLSSSFRISHISGMPAVIYAGQNNISAMKLSLSSPLSFGSGNILVRGITITARSDSGQPVNFSSFASAVMIQHVSSTAEASSPPASDTLYLSFPQHVTISASGESVSVIINILSSAAAGGYRLLIDSASDIDAYQDNEPSREIFITADAGDSFPMSSGTGYISGSSAGISFSSYPNPFTISSGANLSYYLDSSTDVTIIIYDIMGNKIRSIIENSPRQAGSHSSDTWDGKDDSGKYAVAGTYLGLIETKNGKKQLIKITFIK